MSVWKVILATLVIFIAGLVTGAIGARQLLKPLRSEWLQKSGSIPAPLRNEYISSLTRDLGLSPAQRLEVSNIVQESQARVRYLHDEIEPDVRDEIRQTREDIRDLLTPDQRRRFDELRRKHRRPERSGPTSQIRSDEDSAR